MRHVIPIVALAVAALFIVPAGAQTIEVELMLEAFDGCGCTPPNPPYCPEPHNLRWPFREDWWTYRLNTSGPTVAGETPVRRSSISSLPTVQVTFSEAVTGVTAGLLKVNDRAATSVSGSGAGPYTFSGYRSPGDGVVRVELGAGSITGASGGFGGTYWTYQKNRPDWITVVSVSPAMDSTVGGLSSIQVTFSESVTDVLPSHCRVGGSSATTVTGYGAGPYEFTGFEAPADGVVCVELGRGTVPVIYAETATGCNVHDRASNFPHPGCPGFTGLPYPYPNDSYFADFGKVDQDWANVGWPVNWLGNNQIKNGVEPENQGSQSFSLASQTSFADVGYAQLGYINPQNPQDTAGGSFGRMLFQQMLDDYNVLHPDTPKPPPVAGQTVHLAYDVMRTGDGFGGTDPNNPGLAITASIIIGGILPDGLTLTMVPASERRLPSDAAWHTYRIAEISDFPEKAYIGVEVALDPSSQQPYPAIMTEDVSIYIDNLRLIYQAYPLPENCSNGRDDDGDALVDCDDDDCYMDPNCPCNMILTFDTDFDGDVDQVDFSLLQSCFTGTGDPGGVFGSLPETCQCLDITGPGGVPDSALDQQDLVAFEACASGPGIPADPACDD